MPPWSRNQLRKLGECIRDGKDIPNSLPDYGAVMQWYNEAAIATQQRLEQHDWTLVLGSKSPEVTSRPKTIDTLRQKLQRDRSTPLSSIQDVAGVRLEAEMTLTQQDQIVDEIVAMFGEDPAQATHDMRGRSHSGYRAVHVWLRGEARVEVQVRTHLQGNWANMYESAADMLGRGIRYGEFPDDAEARFGVEQLQEISDTMIAFMEESKDAFYRADLGLPYLERPLSSPWTAQDLSPELLYEKAVLTDRAVVALRANALEVEASMQQTMRTMRDNFDRARKAQNDPKISEA